MKRKKPVLRRCVGCYQMFEKKTLIRVNYHESSGVSVDETGANKGGGRGAYVCKNAACLERAKKHKGLERSLHKAASEKPIRERSAAKNRCVISKTQDFDKRFLTAAEGDGSCRKLALTKDFKGVYEALNDEIADVQQ